MNVHILKLKSSFRRAARIGMLGALSLAPAVFADSVPVSMKLTGTVNSQTLGGYYVNPYVADINGIATTVICDDFSAHSYFDQEWEATETTFSTDAQLQAILENSPQSLRWGTEAEAFNRYKQVAWLSLQLVNNIGNTPAQGEISFAIWKVFTPEAINTLSQESKNGVDLWAKAAVLAVNGSNPDWSNGATFSLYTPVAVSGDQYPYTYTQEFVSVRTPESSSVPMLAFNFGAVIVIACLLRRRLRNPVK